MYGQIDRSIDIPADWTGEARWPRLRTARGCRRALLLPRFPLVGSMKFSRITWVGVGVGGCVGGWVGGCVGLCVYVCIYIY